MLGIIVQLAISWLIVWLLEKRNLSVLGFRPTKDRLSGFFIFLLLTAFFCSTTFLMQMYLGKREWRLSPNLSVELALAAIWWNIKSVLFEELIFRGVLLYILIKKFGATKAIILSAIGFGIYHWFSLGVLGNITQMVIIFFLTGLMGLLLAYGYAKTFSLYVPVAIHLGWNLTQIFIFSQGPIGDGLLVPLNKKPFRTDSYILFIIVTFVPMFLMLLTNYLLLKKRRQVHDTISAPATITSFESRGLE